jgi:predicted GNAT family acetyltransferase
MVEHQTDQQRFIVATVEGEARLSYRMLSPDVMDMMSTFVPPRARGRGTAAELVQTALAFARNHKLQVIPTCWYVGEFIDAHPEFSDLLEPVRGRAPDRSGASCDIV